MYICTKESAAAAVVTQKEPCTHSDPPYISKASKITATKPSYHANSTISSFSLCRMQAYLEMKGEM